MSDVQVKGSDTDPCDDCSQPPATCAECESGSKFVRRGDLDDDGPACYRGKDACDLCRKCDDDVGDDGDHPYDTTPDQAWVPCKMRKIDLRERGYESKGHQRRAYRYWAALDKRRHRLVLAKKIAEPPWRSRSWPWRKP